MAEKGLYLYCIIKNNLKEDLSLNGIKGEKIYSIIFNELAVIVSSCDQEQLSLNDTQMASQFLLTHHAVIDYIFDKYENIVPFSFGTIMIGKEGKTAQQNLYKWLENQSDMLQEKLKKLEGKAEYGIQISWNSTIVAPKFTKYDDEINKLEQEIKLKTPGVAYMLKEKLENLIKNKLESAALIYFKEFYKKINELSSDIKIEKTKKEKEPFINLANLSCLVQKNKVKELGEELDKINNINGFYVRFTGPWPPYSFA